ncbi:MAG: hypothetical protein ABIA62_08525, partial [Candidatus Woesearchaeota archaeon]
MAETKFQNEQEEQHEESILRLLSNTQTRKVGNVPVLQMPEQYISILLEFNQRLADRPNKP